MAEFPRKQLFYDDKTREKLAQVMYNRYFKQKKSKKSLDDQLDDIVENHLNNRILKAFMSVRKEISKDIEITLTEIIEKGVKNPKINLSSIRNYRDMDKRIMKIMLNFLENELPYYIYDLFFEVYMKGVVDVDNDLENMKLPIKADYKKVNLDHINAILITTSDYFVRASKGITTTVKSIINQRVNEQLLKKIMTGQDIRRATKDLVTKLEKDGIRFVTTSKRKYQLHTYAEMVLRTESRYMHTEAVMNRANDNGYYYVKISKHSDPCSDKCKPHEGKIFFVGKNEKDNFLNKKHLDEVRGVDKLFHPNCRHVAMVYPARK